MSQIITRTIFNVLLTHFSEYNGLFIKTFSSIEWYVYMADNFVDFHITLVRDGSFREHGDVHIRPGLKPVHSTRFLTVYWLEGTKNRQKFKQIGSSNVQIMTIRNKNQGTDSALTENSLNFAVVKFFKLCAWTVVQIQNHHQISSPLFLKSVLHKFQTAKMSATAYFSDFIVHLCFLFTE